MNPLMCKRRRQTTGFVCGSFVGLGLAAFLALPGQEGLLRRGPMNTGHEELACGQCHERAPGTLRQQLQANARHLLGWRESGADFGFRDVGNGVCLDCHERPNDRHPVFRFVEPRFAEARLAIGSHLCLSCHLEHSGRRVTAERTYCRHCHEELSLKNDPISEPHAALVAEGRWETCLGCHDFHGNHLYDVEHELEAAIPESRVAAYFAGGASPYSATKLHEAREERSGD